MKVKSFCVGLVNGVEGAMKTLDECVSNLGNVQIHQLTDTFYPSLHEMMETGGNTFSPRINRVVLYD